MTFVNHHKGVIFLCKFTDLIHRSYIAIHREHSISSDDFEAAIFRLLQTTLQILHIGILIAETFRFA